MRSGKEVLVWVAGMAALEAGRKKAILCRREERKMIDLEMKKAIQF
jgi:hypothetical protein